MFGVSHGNALLKNVGQRQHTDKSIVFIDDHETVNA